MKAKRYDGLDVRRILCGMIMDRYVLSRITENWTNEGLFDSSWANIVGKMCVEYFKKFDRPPTEQMTALFQDFANKETTDDKTIDQIEKFLQALSDEYRSEPADYILDIAGKYFNGVIARKVMETANREVDRGEGKEALDRLAEAPSVNLGEGSYVEPLKDISLWERAMNVETKRPLVFYRGDLGTFIGDSFTRNSFYSFYAPDKTGKTTWEVDLTYRSLRNRNRVAYFDMGDGNLDEFMTRLACRVSGRPEYDQTIDIPTHWDDKGELVIEKKNYKAVDHFEAFREISKFAGGGNLRFSEFPMSSATVTDIDRLLQTWEDKGWRPDVLVVDYADIIAPPRGIKDPLDQIDVTWKQLRRISQKRHCLVITATQTAASAYQKDGGLLTRADFSGRKTKLAHVNGMIGINVSSKDKEAGLAKINWVVRRKGYYNERAYVTVAGNLAIQNPAIISKR